MLAFHMHPTRTCGHCVDCAADIVIPDRGYCYYCCWAFSDYSVGTPFAAVVPFPPLLPAPVPLRDGPIDRRVPVNRDWVADIPGQCAPPGHNYHTIRLRHQKTIAIVCTSSDPVRHTSCKRRPAKRPRLRGRTAGTSFWCGLFESTRCKLWARVDPGVAYNHGPRGPARRN